MFEENGSRFSRCKAENFKQENILEKTHFPPIGFGSDQHTSKDQSLGKYLEQKYVQIIIQILAIKL